MLVKRYPGRWKRTETEANSIPLPPYFWKWGEQSGSGADWLPHSENRSTSIIVTQLGRNPNTLHTLAAARLAAAIVHATNTYCYISILCQQKWSKLPEIAQCCMLKGYVVYSTCLQGTVNNT